MNIVIQQKLRRLNVDLDLIVTVPEPTADEMKILAAKWIRMVLLNQIAGYGIASVEDIKKAMEAKAALWAANGYRDETKGY